MLAIKKFAARRLRRSNPQEARDALERFCGASKDKELLERAKQLLQEIK